MHHDAAVLNAECTSPWCLRRMRVDLFRRFFVVDLAPLVYGLDSTLWLPTVLSYATLLAPHDAERVVSYAQFLPSMVQLVVSILTGPVAAYFSASLKWCIVFFLLCSAAGNTVYACAGPHAIGHAWALIGGHMLSGAASGAASLALSYIVMVASADDRLAAVSLYRAFVGVALAVGPLLTVPLQLVSFRVGLFAVDSNNAAAWVMAFFALALAGVVSMRLRDVHVPHANHFRVRIQHAAERSMRRSWVAAAAVLVLIAASSFLLADVFFVLSVLLTDAAHWHMSLIASSCVQGAVFGVALVGSVAAEHVRGWVQRRRRAGPAAGDADVPEIGVGLVSFVGAVVGLTLVLIALRLDKVRRTQAGALACLLIGCGVMVTAYNVQAASLPSLFSQCLPASARPALTPWYAAAVALGKAGAPLVVQALSRTADGMTGWVVAELVCVGVAVPSVVLFVCMCRPLCAVVARERRRAG